MKIFRRIRRQLLKNNRIRSYFFYAIGEIFLVVVGILLALQINTWNENRKRQALKDNYIESLEQDLRDDLGGLKNRLENEELQRNQLIEFQEKLTHPQATMDTLIHLARYEFGPKIYPNFSFNNETYTALIATGDIGLFDQSQIRMLNELSKLHKSANNTMAWSAQLYQSNIGHYTLKYPMNLSGVTINKGPLNQKIWDKIDPLELLTEFNGITSLKRNKLTVSIYELKILIKKTEEVLEELGS